MTPMDLTERSLSVTGLAIQVERPAMGVIDPELILIQTDAPPSDRLPRPDRCRDVMLAAPDRCRDADVVVALL